MWVVGAAFVLVLHGLPALRHYNMATLRQEIHPLEGAVLRHRHPAHSLAGAPPLLHHRTTPTRNVMKAARDTPPQDGRSSSNESRTVLCLLTKVGCYSLSAWSANGRCCDGYQIPR